jgi:predicted type IV restriction endonuclease
LELKDAHAKQAVDYAANLGVEWVALTNGQMWKVFRVISLPPESAQSASNRRTTVRPPWQE